MLLQLLTLVAAILSLGHGLQRTQRRNPRRSGTALATVRRFNATLSAKGYLWFWPKIAAPSRPNATG
jgi:hypothetical protein